jgi:hypothetical protein
LRDHVRLPRKAGETVTCDAGTYAFDETNSKYLGGVSWGFRTDAAGKSTLKAAAHHSGNPSGVQKEALERWNEQADLADVTLRNAPTQAKVVVPGD